MGSDQGRELEEQKVIKVGDKVRVTKKIEERSTYKWPGLANGN